jgi:hypothetical protein
MTRRTFSAVTAASYSRVMGANDRIGLGYIGVGARGDRLHELALAEGTSPGRKLRQPRFTRITGACWTTRRSMRW